jgi:hypothetical protein
MASRRFWRRCTRLFTLQDVEKFGTTSANLDDGALSVDHRGHQVVAHFDQCNEQRSTDYGKEGRQNVSNADPARRAIVRAVIVS